MLDFKCGRVPFDFSRTMYIYIYIYTVYKGTMTFVVKGSHIKQSLGPALYRHELTR